LLRIIFWFAASLFVSLFYINVFENIYGSPKEKRLSQQIDELKFRYSLVGRELDNSQRLLNSFRMADEIRYRPILSMDSIPESYRMAGFGGVDRFIDLKGYQNSDMMVMFRTRLEEIKNIANIQRESFSSVSENTKEWKTLMDHMPWISPVSVEYRLGDGLRFRDVHPVLGVPRMHYGQDFSVPYGTNVYATGNGTVIKSDWNSGGLGNCIVIDHGYGIHSIYGHLSNIKVTAGMNIKRGDLIGFSGSTGISSGPHLHYQIEQYGAHKNPINFFNNDISVDEFNEMIQAYGSKSKFR
jgi:murein DD-endopeptidase MepM/ murein hydrolase activator NlpD